LLKVLNPEEERITGNRYWIVWKLREVATSYDRQEIRGVDLIPLFNILARINPGAKLARNCFKLLKS